MRRTSRGFPAYAVLLACVLLSACSPRAAAQVVSDYQAELVAARTAVGVNLGRVVGADSFDTLDSALRAGILGLRDESGRLDRVRPPAQLAAAHAELVAGLEGLASGLEQVNADVNARRLCADSSVLADIGELPSVASLRAVTDRLAATAGAQRWDGILPPAGVPTDRRLPNGQIVVDNRASGGSLFTVDNGAQLDAVVTLAQAGRAIVAVYVGRMEQVTVEDLPLGGYEVFFTQGTDWDDVRKLFARDCLFSRFDEISEFTRTQYWKFGLEPVIGGNAPSSPVAPENYPRG